jgi:hypothetical protein
MGQVTIYLDPETERKMQAMVKQSGLSKSKWIANLIRENTADVWPKNIKQLAGTWKDLPTGDEIRKDLGQDLERESF